MFSIDGQRVLSPRVPSDLGHYHLLPEIPLRTLTRVVAAVICQGNSLLICHRPTHKRHGGLWEFPGGKLEPGETLLEAADRELREELGVRVSAVGPTYLAVQDPGSEFLIEFVAVEIEGIPKAIEHQAIAWTAPCDLLNYRLAPSDRRFAEHLRGHAPQ